MSEGAQNVCLLGLEHGGMEEQCGAWWEERCLGGVRYGAKTNGGCKNNSAAVVSNAFDQRSCCVRLRLDGEGVDACGSASARTAGLVACVHTPA